MTHWNSLFKQKWLAIFRLWVYKFKKWFMASLYQSYNSLWTDFLGQPADEPEEHPTQCTFIKDPKLKQECEDCQKHGVPPYCDIDDSPEYVSPTDESEENVEPSQCKFIEGPKRKQECKDCVKHGDVPYCTQCTFIKNAKLAKECEENLFLPDDSPEYVPYED